MKINKFVALAALIIGCGGDENGDVYDVEKCGSTYYAMPGAFAVGLSEQWLISMGYSKISVTPTKGYPPNNCG